MDACSPKDPCQEVILKFSSQSGKTEVVLNFLGYIIDLDPGPTLAIQPNQKPMAEAFSKDRVSPMIRDTITLREKISPMKSRDGLNTIYHKKFAGGHLTIGGSNSPAGLASRPIRFLLADELDRWELTKEGDAMALAEVRTRTFLNRKILKVSSPTLEGMGIDAEYDLADQQHELHLTCPDCQQSQFPLFRHIDIDRADLSASGYICEHCGTRHPFRDEMQIKKTAHWVCKKIDGDRSKAYWMNQWGSPLSRWQDTIRQWLRAQGDNEKLRVVVNTAFAETWSDPGEVIDETGLIARREDYGTDPIPDGVLIIAAGVDVQDDRLEVEVIGYGRDHESWGIEYRVIWGDPDKLTVWHDLDQLLAATWQTEDERRLTLSAMCIDSGGHKTEAVYDYCYKRSAQRVWSVKGMAGEGRPIVSAPARRKYGKKQRPIKLWTVGVDTAKTRIYSRLKIADPGPGYCHFPMRYTEEWFSQITAEKKVERRVKGFSRFEWIKIRARNEALDVRVYALAAITLLNPDYAALARLNRPQPQKKPKRKPQPREIYIR